MQKNELYLYANILPVNHKTKNDPMQLWCFIFLGVHDKLFV